MNEVIERLRAAKREADTAAYGRGWEHGRKWAAEEACPYVLEDIEIALKTGDPSYSFAYPSWLKPEDVRNPNYIAGFVGGALSLWAEVKDVLGTDDPLSQL